jgi:hypothetical protein
MLVARSADRCARLVASLLRNDQELELVDDDHNYRLIERSTGSVIRVISSDSMVVNAYGLLLGYASARPVNGGADFGLGWWPETQIGSDPDT